MAHPNEQQGNRKSVAWQGPIIRLPWGERWRLLGLLGVFVLLGLRMASAQAVPFAYITNFASDSVSIINTANETVVAGVAVDPRPVVVVVNSEGTRVYVVHDSGGVSVIDTASNTVIAKVVAGVVQRFV